MQQSTSPENLIFYKKKDFTSGIIREEYIDKEQSALWYLKDYLKVLNDK